MADFRDQLNTFFSRLSLQQKVVLAIGILVTISLFVLLFSWTTRPNYEVLFSNLAQKDAGKIVDKLKEQNVQYQLDNGGSTVKVPTEKVYELRLAFAQEGLPESGGVGYEIFDKTNLGMTDFIQQVNYRRALEGELGRTIEQIETVEHARVHIVLPKEALFKDDQKEATASVILKLKGNTTPSSGSILGLCNLVASSVEGLKSENITVMDTRGRILSDNHDPNDLVTMSGTQLEFSKKVETYFSQKAQSMLDQVVGVGNSVVRVTAQLDFTQVEKSTEFYDPENSAIRGEQITEESTPMADAAGTNNGVIPTSKRNNTSTNYELNKTVQHTVEGIGDVKRLSVAVMVNNKREIVTDATGKKEIKYSPRDQKELEKLSNLVRTAVGYQQERGDDVSVINVDFNVPEMEEEMLTAEKPNIWNNWYDLVEKGFLILAILAAMFILRSIFGQVKKRNEDIEKQIIALTNPPEYAQLNASPNAAKGNNIDQMDDEVDDVIMAENFFQKVKAKDPLTKNLHSFLKDKPEEAARLIKVWMMEDEEGGY